MKYKYWLYLLLSMGILALISCGAPASGGPAQSEPAVAEAAEKTIACTPDRDTVAELDPGFSMVRFEGDYGFDLFLEQGGAVSDGKVLAFLAATFLPQDMLPKSLLSAFGCSTLSVPGTDGGYLFGRNFDWQPCDAMVVAAYPAGGYASISTVNVSFIKQSAGLAAGLLTDDVLAFVSLYAPLDGMNEKGLCVCVNMIQDNATIQQNTDKPDLTTTTAVRMLLDKAATVEEAVGLLAQYDMHASMNYMVHFAIADQSGASVAVEYIDGEMVVTPTPVLTNFYLAEGNKQGIGTQQSHTRFDILTDTLEQTPVMDRLGVRDALNSVSKHNFGEFESTEWSVVFDQSALAAFYYRRENYARCYSFTLP